MKFIYIKWRRGDMYEKRGERKSAIKNAHRTVRQSCRNQLRKIGTGFRFPDNELEDPLVDFIHPSIRLGFFD